MESSMLEYETAGQKAQHAATCREHSTYAHGSPVQSIDLSYQRKRVQRCLSGAAAGCSRPDLCLEPLTVPPRNCSSAFTMAQTCDAPEVVPATQHEAQQSKWSNFETVFTNAKAGMGGVDKEHVKRIVYEMSKVGVSVHTVVNHFML